MPMDSVSESNTRAKLVSVVVVPSYHRRGHK